MSFPSYDHLFRQESGRLVAALTRLLGLGNLETAQDLAQDTLLQALHSWGYGGWPDDPAAWLHRVARNKAIDFLRRRKKFRQLTPDYRYLMQSEEGLTATVSHFFEPDIIEDSQLRMLFACCHPALPVEVQLALALRTLCGLSTAEIARAFLLPEETVAKRLYRAKEKIRSEAIRLELPPPGGLPARLDAVLHAVYLLFNEGYGAARHERPIREELCHEALHLAILLSRNARTCAPRTQALLALLCLQAARLPARLDAEGQLVLLEQQDRRLWFRPLLQQGLHYLNRATVAPESSVYHFEAAIAALHAVAPSFASTDWTSVYRLYRLLYTHHPTPFIALSKAIAARYACGWAKALEELEAIQGLERYHLYHAAVGDVYKAGGHADLARQHYATALSLAEAPADRALLQRKLEA